MSDQAKHPEGCLFCRRHDGGFKSEEHIVSRAFGNREDVLPPGVVCDRCNNGHLARADRSIADLEPLQLLRSERGLGTRSGRGVVARFKEAEIAFTEPGVLSVFGIGPSPVTKLGLNQYRMSTTGTSPFKSTRAMSVMRGMWKTVIEYIYFDHGPQAAFSAVLDPARREVIEDGDGHGWVVIPQTAQIHDVVQTTYQPRWIDGRIALPMLLDVFGVRFYSDPVRRSLSRQYIERTLPWPANVWVFPKAPADSSTAKAA